MNRTIASLKTVIKEDSVHNNKKRNKKITIFSLLGFGIMTLGITLPLGIMANFDIKLNNESGNSGIDYSKPLSDTNPSFKSWYVRDWANLYLSDININLSFDAINPENKITLDNLLKIGIIPNQEYDKVNNWNNWVWVKSSPILNVSDGFAISILQSNIDKDPFTYQVKFKDSSTPAIKSSPYYTVGIPHKVTSEFISYPAISLKNISDFYVEYTKNSLDPETDITLKNLEKIGIVPFLDYYTSWESITMFPENATTANVSIKKGPNPSDILVYKILGIEKSNLYNTKETIYNLSNDFIMYTSNNWLNLFPIEAALTLTSDSTNVQNKISIYSLEKIGIVPKNNNYKNWTSVTIRATASRTCEIIIKENNDVIVAKFNAKSFKFLDSYDVDKILYQANDDFIMYAPKNWANLYPVEANFKLTANSLNEETKISLYSLEEIGIVPKNNSYKNWSSVAMSAKGSGTAEISIKTDNDQNEAAKFSVTLFKFSNTYDVNNIIHSSFTDIFNFIWYRPKIWTSSIWPNEINLLWNQADITLEILETIGIVPLNDSYKAWTLIRKNTLDYGSKGKFNITMLAPNSQSLSFEVGGFYTSTLFDNNRSPNVRVNFVYFDHIYAFQGQLTQAEFDKEFRVILTGDNITIANLEKYGIVPTDTNVSSWINRIQYFSYSPENEKVRFQLVPRNLDGSDGTIVDLYYPIIYKV